MMAIVMFAIVGALLDPPAGYWIAYGILTGIKVALAAAKAVKEAE